MAGQQPGDVAHNARAVVADQLQPDHPPAAPGRAAAGRQQHANALAFQFAQRVEEFGLRGRRHRHLQDARELPGHPRHATVQPVAAVARDAVGQALDQPWLILGDDRENEVIHGWLLHLELGCTLNAAS